MCSNLTEIMNSNITTILLLVVAYGNCATAQGTTLADVTMKLAQMEATIGSLKNEVQVLKNKQSVVATQLNECKMRDDDMQQTIMLLKNNLQVQIGAWKEFKKENEAILITVQNKLSSWQDSRTKLLITNAVNQINRYGVHLDVLERKVTNSELQILNLITTDKNLSSTLQIHLTLANQKFSNISDFNARQQHLEHKFTELEKNLTCLLETHVSQSKQYFVEIVLKQVNLKQTVADHSSKLETLFQDNANMKSEQSYLERNLKNIGAKQQNLEHQFANQVSEDGKRMDILEKHATSSKLQISNLENKDKSFSSALQSYVTLSNQTFSDLLLKQNNIAKSINVQHSLLMSLQASDATINANRDLLKRQIQNMEKTQNSLKKRVKSQESQLLKLENSGTRNIRQVVWNHDSSLDCSSIETVQYHKKETHSGLWLSFYGVLRVKGKMGVYRCGRWWFELNGAECSNPAKVEGVIAVRGTDDYFTPSVVSGICYGIPAGTVTIVFKVGGCGKYGYPTGDAYTGLGQIASHIIIEEIAK